MWYTFPKAYPFAGYDERMKINEIQPEESLRILAVSPGLRDINPVVNQINNLLPEETKLISAGRKNTDIVNVRANSRK